MIHNIYIPRKKHVGNIQRHDMGQHEVIPNSHHTYWRRIPNYENLPVQEYGITYRGLKDVTYGILPSNTGNYRSWTTYDKQ